MRRYQYPWGKPPIVAFLLASTAATYNSLRPLLAQPVKPREAPTPPFQNSVKELRVDPKKRGENGIEREWIRGGDLACDPGLMSQDPFQPREMLKTKIKSFSRTTREPHCHCPLPGGAQDHGTLGGGEDGAEKHPAQALGGLQEALGGKSRVRYLPYHGVIRKGVRQSGRGRRERRKAHAGHLRITREGAIHGRLGGAKFPLTVQVPVQGIRG